jgi:hypothetical protein
MRVLLLVAAAFALTACAASSGPAPARAPASASRVGVVRVPAVMAPQGLEGVIGSPAGALTNRFGTPRLDVPEGDVRKLQFAGEGCVLDIYLYPLSPGAEPTAAHVAARQRQGGAEADAGACIRALERR